MSGPETPVTTGTSTKVDEGVEDGRGGPRRRDGILLLSAVLLWAVAVVALGELRVLELTTSTWDMGVYQQALWSAGHGRGFYENPDWETGGFSSFLQVHTAFVLYAVAPLYDVAPYQSTLLVLQAVLVGLAALPLYGLTRDLTGSSRTGLAVALLFLAWTPTIGGVLYDFHAEAFVPVEYLAFAFLWNRRSYPAAFVVALLGFLSFDLVPVLLATFALIAAVPPDLGHAVRDRGWGAWRVELGRLLDRMRQSEARWALFLFVASVAAYALLLAVRTTGLSNVVGLGPVPPLDRGYIIGSTPSELGLSPSFLVDDLAGKLEYWGLVYALVLFLPFLSPRHALLAAPWVGYTLFSFNANYVALGFQYGLLAAGPVFVGAAHGAVRVPGLLARLRARGDRAPAIDPRSAGPDGRPPARRGRLPGGISPLLPCVVLLLAVNLSLTPLDPLTQYVLPGSAYQVSYTLEPGWSNVEALAELIPGRAGVLATNDVFPLVANDPNAWSLLWMADPSLQLPYGPAQPPPYAFLSEQRIPTFPPWLPGELANSSIFGVRAMAWTTPVGPVALFEEGYTGPTLNLGSVPPTSETYPANAWSVGPDGRLESAPSAPGGWAVESLAGSEGEIAQAPYGDLVAGNYSLSLQVQAQPVPGATPPSAGSVALIVNANGFPSALWFSENLTYGEISAGAWVTVTFFLDLADPAWGWEFRAYAATTDLRLSLAELRLSPSPGS